MGHIHTCMCIYLALAAKFVFGEILVDRLNLRREYSSHTCKEKNCQRQMAILMKDCVACISVLTFTLSVLQSTRDKWHMNCISLY